MALDDLPPRDALDESASGDAPSAPSADRATPAAPSQDRAGDDIAAPGTVSGEDETGDQAAPDADGGGAAGETLASTQAFDVARLIAQEKRATRRAMSAADLDALPVPGSRRERREAAEYAEALGFGRGADDDTATDVGAGGEAGTDEDAGGDDEAAADRTVDRDAAGGGAGAVALAWIDPAAISAQPATVALTESSHVPVTNDLLPPIRERRRAAVAAPLITAAALAVAYVGGCAAWPLDNVAASVSSATVEPAAGNPLGVTWPGAGTAAVGAEGLGTIAAAGTEAAPMASITKLVTVLMILEKAPLAVGESGPSYGFTLADNQLYWQYRYQNESALDVPVDGRLTERQMLEGILIGSANNYVDRLTTELWGSKEAFVAAVPAWLKAHGLTGLTLVDPSGIDPGNVATPSALVKLASVALADPVVAEIVAMPKTNLPGAGEVKNTNPLLSDQGVVGVKTGTLLEGWAEQWNLLTAKDITIGQTTVRVYAAVLGQPDDKRRTSVSRELLAQVERSLQPVPSVAEGTTVATITTEWGENAAVLTEGDASVVLWDSGTAAVESDYDIEIGLEDGARVGELTATGPFDSASVPLVLEGDVPGPDLLWRLSHPLDLLGLR